MSRRWVLSSCRLGDGLSRRHGVAETTSEPVESMSALASLAPSSPHQRLQAVVSLRNGLSSLGRCLAANARNLRFCSGLIPALASVRGRCYLVQTPECGRWLPGAISSPRGKSMLLNATTTYVLSSAKHKLTHHSLPKHDEQNLPGHFSFPTPLLSSHRFPDLS